MRKSIILGVVLGLLVAGSLAYAQSSTPTPTPTGVKSPRVLNNEAQKAQRDARQKRLEELHKKQVDIRVMHERTRAEIRTKRIEQQGIIRDTQKQIRENPERRAELLKNVQEERKELVEFRNREREELQKDMKERRDVAREKILLERDALREKLGTIRDERKRGIVERADKRLEEIANTEINGFTRVLDNLDKVLEKIDSRADKAEANGKNVSSVRTAITNAENLLKTARDLVTAQASKTYPINVTTEQKLGEAVSAARLALHADLKKVRDAIQKARKAVTDANSVLRAIPGVDSEPTATPTPTPITTPTPTPTPTSQ